MTDKRKQDSSPGSWYRSLRMFESEGKWYFFTREGSVEGPFDDRLGAIGRLETYIKLVNSDLVTLRDDLAVEPLELAVSQ